VYHECERCRRGGAVQSVLATTTYIVINQRVARQEGGCLLHYCIMNYRGAAEWGGRCHLPQVTKPCTIIYNERSIAKAGVLCHLQHRAVTSITEAEEGSGAVLQTIACIVTNQRSAELRRRGVVAVRHTSPCTIINQRVALLDHQSTWHSKRGVP
jgi:hypothetical protein